MGNMGKWKYRLGLEGTKLRELIKNSNKTKESAVKIVNQLQLCIKSLIFQLNESEEHIKEALEELLFEVDENYFETDEEFVIWINDVLADFYDICDECRCWIAL